MNNWWRFNHLVLWKACGRSGGFFRDTCDGVFLQLVWENVPEGYRMEVERTFICESDRAIDSDQLQFKGEAAALNVQAEVIQPRFQLLHGGGRQLT